MYICPLCLDSLSHLPPIPTPLGYYRALVWVPWVIHQIPIGYLFTYVSVYASMLLSPFIWPSPSSPQPLSISVFSMSASPLLLCEQICQYHPSRFHMYTLVYDICFSLSDLLHSVPGRDRIPVELFQILTQYAICRLPALEVFLGGRRETLVSLAFCRGP